MGEVYGALDEDPFDEVYCYEKALELNPHDEHIKWKFNEALKEYPDYYDAKLWRKLSPLYGN